MFGDLRDFEVVFEIIDYEIGVWDLFVSVLFFG